MAHTDKLVTLLEKLITDGEQMIKNVKQVVNYRRRDLVPLIEDSEAVLRWSNELILFRSIAGDAIRPWSERLKHDGMVLLASGVERPLSTLKTIRAAIAEGLLTRYEDLVVADVFGDLTEQAEYLLSQNYSLAAGVIFRAILEERLRKLCIRNKVNLKQPLPTIHDFNQGLYTATPPVYDKSMMHQITALAAIGNDAAHNKPGLKPEDVQRLATGVRDFLARFSV